MENGEEEEGKGRKEGDERDGGPHNMCSLGTQNRLSGHQPGVNWLKFVKSFLHIVLVYYHINVA
jgi:hypothetical protein